MNARQAVEVSKEMTSDLLDSSRKLSEFKKISINEAIDYQVSICQKYAKNVNEATAWYLRGKEAKKMITV